MKRERRCLKMAKAGHERQRLFPQHFWASENRVQKERHSRNYFHKEFPSGMSYKPAGKDDGIFRPLPTRLFWILIHPFHDSIEQSYRCILLDVYFAVQRHGHYVHPGADERHRRGEVSEKDKQE